MTIAGPASQLGRLTLEGCKLMRDRKTPNQLHREILYFTSVCTARRLATAGNARTARSRSHEYSSREPAVKPIVLPIALPAAAKRQRPSGDQATA